MATTYLSKGGRVVFLPIYKTAPRAFVSVSLQVLSFLAGAGLDSAWLLWLPLGYNGGVTSN